MGHEHSVIDSDRRFIIDPIKRTVKSENNQKIMLMQYDHNSERFTFQCPKVIEGHDMSECTDIQVHFLNIDAQTRKQNKGLYLVDDLKTEDDNVVFSWLVKMDATQLVGSLAFIITFLCVKDDIVEYRWSTAENTEMSIGNGINADEDFETEYSDIIGKWKESVMQTFRDDLDEWKETKEIEIKNNINTWKKESTDKIFELLEHITPQMFGAVGDGVTDDTEAFKRTIEYAVSIATGESWKVVKKIFIPKGTYLISASLLDDNEYRGYKFVFEGESYTNTIIKVASECSVLFPNNDIYGFSTFSNISFSGADNTQTFMEILSGATGNAQSIYFHRCSFTNFHTILKLGKASGVTYGTMTSETLLSECKISNCGTTDNPCELFILDNQQSVNNRFYATDIEAFRGILFKFKEGNAITFYQGSIIPLSGSIIVDGTELDGNSSGGGNQPNLTMWGCRFELRGNTKLLNHGSEWGQLVLSFNECGMGCTNLDEGVKPIYICGTASAFLYFNKCRNAKTLYAEMVNMNTNTSRSNVLTKIYFEECDINVKDFVENSSISFVGNNTYVAHPEIKINGIHYNIDNTVKKSPLGNHLRVIERCLLNGVYYTGFECGYKDHPKSQTVDVYSYIQEITLNNLGNGVFAGYTGNVVNCAIYDEEEKLLGNINGIPVPSGSGSLKVNKYVKKLKFVFVTDMTINTILPIIALAKIVG